MCDLIFNGLSPFNGALLLGLSFVASFITVSLGIGGGVLLLAVMASIFPPAALIPVHGVIQLGANLVRCLVLLRHVTWPPLISFAVGSVAGVLLGGQLVVTLPSAWVQIGVGAFVIWSIWMRPPAWLARWPWLTGAFSSFLTMFFGATGPFVATFSKALNQPRQAHVATHAAMMTLQHLLKTLGFGLLGFAFAPWLPFIVLMILLGAAGTAIGKQLLLRISDKAFRRGLDLALLILSLRLIWVGVHSLMA
jgi:uncharacterized membrane protein YfcA